MTIKQGKEMESWIIDITYNVMCTVCRQGHSRHCRQLVRET